MFILTCAHKDSDIHVVIVIEAHKNSNSCVPGTSGWSIIILLQYIIIMQLNFVKL